MGQQAKDLLEVQMSMEGELRRLLLETRPVLQNYINELKKQGLWDTEESPKVIFGCSRATLNKVRNYDEKKPLPVISLDFVKSVRVRLAEGRPLFGGFSERVITGVLRQSWNCFYLTRDGSARKPVIEWRYVQLKFTRRDGVFVAKSVHVKRGQDDRAYEIVLYGNDRRFLLHFRHVTSAESTKRAEDPGGCVFPSTRLLVDAMAKTEGVLPPLAGIGVWTDWHESGVVSKCLLFPVGARPPGEKPIGPLPESGERMPSGKKAVLDEIWNTQFKEIYKIGNLLEGF